ncbi:MAG: tyrosine-protein phosphatase [Peptococcaceae bacterium]|nr:tyrosine-protein phosphatase [Peptococcaceae bacterium]
MEAALKQTRHPKQCLNLTTAHNARDLSGYQTADGFITSDRFLRSDCFMPLSDNDAKTLWGLGVRTVIDLRNQDEYEKVPSGLSEYEHVTYVCLPLYSEETKRSLDFDKLPPDFNLGALYIDMLDTHQDSIRRFFAQAAQAREGKILFHCSAGKDRTGLLAALLLKLCGVSDNDVIQDYALTEVFLAQMLPILKENAGMPAQLDKLVDDMLGSDPVHMERLLKHLNAKYNGAQGYLEFIGVSHDDIESLKNCMIERI